MTTVSPIIPITRSTALALLIAGTMAVAGASSSIAQTGSRVGAKPFPGATYFLASPKEIDQVRRLLQDGRTVEAVRTAKSFIELLNERSDARGSAQRLQYYGHNALCLAACSLAYIVGAVVRVALHI